MGAPIVKLVIDQRLELPSEHLACIQAVELDSTDDGADLIRIAVKCSRPGGRVLFRDEPHLQFPQTVDLWTGYGTPSFPAGRFTMKRGEFSNGPQGVTATFVGYDATERLMHHRGPRLFKGYTRTSDVVETIASEYGWTSDITATPAMASLNIVKKRGGKLVALPHDHSKSAGDTDARFLKLLASGNDYLFPYMRLIGSPSGEAREVFHFVPPSWERQKNEASVLQLSYNRTPSSALMKFTPGWSFAGLPTGVRVTAYVGGFWRVVQAEILPTGKVRTEFLGPTANQARPPVFQSSVAAFDTSKAPDPRALYVEVLGSGKVKTIPGSAKVGSKKSPRELETWGRDTVIAFEAGGIGIDPAIWAESWLRTRASLGIAGPAELRNVPGTEQILAGQIHPVLGVGARDSGWYIVQKAQHKFTFGDGGGHALSLRVERQAGELMVGEF